MTRIMIRLAGMLCIIAAGVLAGIGLERRMRKRWQLFREMQETLQFLGKEMLYHRAPVCEAFRSAAKRCGTELGELFSEAAGQIEKRTGRGFQEIWREALAKSIPPDLLTQEELQLFDEAGAALCGTDVVMQKTLLDKYVDRFRLMAGTQEQVCLEKGGLYRKLAAAAGVFLAILFI